jgi:hypothetical protein
LCLNALSILPDLISSSTDMVSTAHASQSVSINLFNGRMIPQTKIGRKSDENRSDMHRNWMLSVWNRVLHRILLIT